MKLKKQELIVCLGFLVLGIAVLVLMPFQVKFAYFTANKASGIRMASTTFPTLTAWLIIGSSCLYLLSILFKYLRAKKAGLEIVIDNSKKMQILVPIAVVACVFVYVWLLRPLGFIIDTMIFALLMGIYLKSTKLQIFISSVIIPVAAYFIFKLMYVNLPSGILPF